MNKPFNKIWQNKLAFLVLLFVVFGFFGSIFVGMPLKDIGKKIPFTIDTYLISWVWDWEWHALTTDPLNFFNANIFAPFEKTLAYTETMLGTAIFAWPIKLLSGNNIALTYNLVVLLTFAINGLGMYLLAFYLTKNRWGSVIASIIYAFAPFKLLHSIEHLHLTGMWLPYFFLCLHKFFKNPNWKNIISTFVFILLIFLTGFHYFIFLPIVILIFSIIYFIRCKYAIGKKALLKVALASITFILIVAPILIPYFQLKKNYNQTRSAETIDFHTPGIADHFISPFLYSLFYKLDEPGSKNTAMHLEMLVSPGVFVYILFAVSLYFVFKYRKKFFKDSKEHWIYLILAVVAFITSLGYHIKWTHSGKPLTIGLYALLYYLPGFSGIRSVGRYVVFTLLSMSALIAYGFKIIFEKNSIYYKKIFIVSVTIVFLFVEFSLLAPAMFLDAPKDVSRDPFYVWVSQQPSGNIYLHMPIGVQDETFVNYDIEYLFNSRHYHEKIVNGYSGHFSPGYEELWRGLKDFDPSEDMESIKRFKTNYLVIHFDRFANKEEIMKEYTAKCEAYEGLKFINNFGDIYIYEVLYD